MRRWLPEQLETVPCDVCGSSAALVKHVRSDGMDVVECPQCGLAFLNPRPCEEFINGLYGEEYFSGQAAERGEGGLRLNARDVSNVTANLKTPASRSVELLSTLAGDLTGKRIIEVGCATGELLLELKQRGAVVQGVELSSFAAQLARQRGLDVASGTIEEYASHLPAKADALLAFEVVEHVLSPGSFLATVSGLIRSGGLLLLSTPNYACTRRYGSEWLGLTGSFEHIYFLETRTLTRLAQRSGLELVYTESTKYLGGPLAPLRGYARLRERVKTLRYFVGEVGWMNALRAILNRTAPVYYCGLGHTLLLAFRKR